MCCAECSRLVTHGLYPLRGISDGCPLTTTTWLLLLLLLLLQTANHRVHVGQADEAYTCVTPGRGGGVMKSCVGTACARRAGVSCAAASSNSNVSSAAHPPPPLPSQRHLLRPGQGWRQRHPPGASADAMVLRVRESIPSV